MACTPELNRLLSDLLAAETLNSATEEQLLQHIRFTVRGLHKESHQQNFHLIRQKDFVARLQTLAKFQQIKEL